MVHNAVLWTVDSTVGSPTPDGTTLSKTFTSVIDYWLAFTNAKLKTIDDTRFGYGNTIFEYGHKVYALPHSFVVLV